MTFLEEIIQSTREVILTAKRDRPAGELKRRIRDLEPPRGFWGAVRRPASGPIRLLAEIKRASPSKGILRDPFDPREIALIYEESGASALSVLTEERFFKGALQNMGVVRGAVKLPVLRKDFLLDEYQVYEARAFGADAVLLIAGLLDAHQMRDYSDIARGLGMAVLTEVHTREELHTVVAAGPDIIGINNRDLRTFKTDPDVSLRLGEEIPEGRTKISESGISDPKQIDRMERAGFDAVLIGEAFMKSADIRSKIRDLFGSERFSGSSSQ
jgi:indole-3-glycerol phosphate synthase